MARIEVNVEANGITQTDAALQKLGRTGANTERQTNKNEEAFRSFGKNAAAAVSAIDGPLGGISSRITSFVTVLTSGTAAMTAFGVAAAGAGFAITNGTLSLDQYNVGLARTEALLRATGNASGQTTTLLAEQAEQLAFNTLTSVDEVQKAQAALLTFNRVTTDVFNEAIILSQDLAETGFGSVSSNAVQLGKALQDPITGISALTEVGISFTNSQKELIRTLQETGDAAGAQQIILEALQEQVGGTGAAVASDSLAGKVDTAGQLWDNFGKIIAERTGALDVARSSVDSVNSALTSLNETLDLSSETNFNRYATEIETTQERVDSLTTQLGRYSDEQRNSLNSGLALSSFESARAAIVRDLTSAIDENRSAQEGLDDIIFQQAQRDQEAEDARAESLERQAQLDREAATERENIAAESARKIADREEAQAAASAEREAARVEAAAQRQQESIDQQTEALRFSFLTREEALLESTLAEAEIISQSTLSQQEQASILTDLWGKYYTDIGQAARDTAAEQASAATEAAREQERQLDRAGNAFSNLNDNLRDTLGEQNAIFKASAITNATINSYNAATGAYAALAPIPIVGPALGAAAAGVALAAGFQNVQAISSARQQGGQVNRGDNVLVGERAPEIFVPDTAGRILNQSQIGQQLGGAGGAQINIYNQAPQTRVQAVKNDDGSSDIYVTRDELSDAMGAAASDPNSDMNQGLRNTYSNLER